MSLLIWLPLNGNLNNQGLDSCTFDDIGGTTGLSTNTNGKIGSCYERTTSLANCYRSSKTFNLSDNITMCCWAYVSDCPSGDTANGIITNHDHLTNTGVGITVKRLSSTDYRISCNTGNGSSRTFHTYYGTTNIKDKWCHLTLTYDKSKSQLKLYVNGTVEYTLNNYINASEEKYIDIFNWSVTNQSNSAYRAICRLNDVRIYDECLSHKQIKEISKALVLHYPMNNIDGVIGGRNLLNGTTNNEISLGTYPSSNYSEGKTYVSNKILNESTYTLSFDAKSTVDGDKIIAHFYNPNSITSIKNSQGYNGTSSDGYCPFTITDGWKRYWVTYTQTTTDDDTKNIIVGRRIAGYGTGNISIRRVKLESGSKHSPWSMSPEDFGIMKDNIIYDTSGFNYHATVSDETCPIWSSDCIIGNGSYQFDTDKYLNTNIMLNNSENDYTISFWRYQTTGSTMPTAFYDNGYLNYFFVEGSYYICLNTGDGSNNPFIDSSGNAITYTLNKWHLYTFVHTNSEVKIYIDGVYKGKATTYKQIDTEYIRINGWYYNDGYRDSGMLNDYRIYATALSDNDIKELYETRFSIADNGTLFLEEIIENQENLSESMNQAFMNNSFENGIQCYVQNNCQVTMENHKMHIYRPATLTVAGNGNTMWGGAKIRFLEVDANLLQKGHTYIILYHVEGQSSNKQSTVGFTNNMGWSGGGLEPLPSNVSYLAIPDNFQGEMECYYKFTIEDDVYKECSTAYSSFVLGIQYPSYKDFQIGWGYTDTGSLGTDIYLSDIRIYDITDMDSTKFGMLSTSLLKCLDLSEVDGNTRILTNETFKVNELIER